VRFYLQPVLLRAIPIVGVPAAEVGFLIERVAQRVEELTEREPLLHPTMATQIANLIREEDARRTT